MDKEIEIINSILTDTKQPLTTSEISKMIFEKYNLKLSKTIVKNYLWSYFRQIIEYSPADYTYKLISDRFLHDNIEVVTETKASRPIFSTVLGNKIIVKIDENLLLDELVKAIAILNFKYGTNNKNNDFVKQLNRTLELFKESQ